jgi:hypothetical protein
MKDKDIQCAIVKFGNGGVIINGQTIPYITGLKVDSEADPFSTITVKFIGKIDGLEVSDNAVTAYHFDKPSTFKKIVNKIKRLVH